MSIFPLHTSMKKIRRTAKGQALMRPKILAEGPYVIKHIFQIYCAARLAVSHPLFWLIPRDPFNITTHRWGLFRTNLLMC
ncbi:MAG: hypothetical protein ACI8XG_001305 [Congregibacter sp.]|jgi:hypothetical protein